MNAASELIRARCRPLAPLPTGIEPVLPRLSGMRAVVFDIYGTLFVSASGDIGLSDAAQQDAALRASVREFGLPLPSRDGNLAEQFCALIQRDHQRARERGIEFPEVEIREIWSELLDHPVDESLEAVAIAYECATNPVWPMPGCRELLTALHEREFLLGLVSNAQFYTPFLFEALLDSDLPSLGFAADLGIFSYAHRLAKPGVALYQMLCDALAERKISAGEVLYVGNDALKDIQPAASLGLRTALFAGDRRSLRLREEVPGLAVPDLVITELSQVLSVLD